MSRFNDGKNEDKSKIR